MVNYAARTVTATVVVLLVVSLVSFSLTLFAPGDAATTVAAQRAGPGASVQQVERVRAELGLDDPLPTQYARWATGVVRGDLGVSSRTGRPISGEVAARLPATLFLAAGSAALATVAGLATGSAAALSGSGTGRFLLRLGALVGVSVPGFWLGYLSIDVFAERLRLLPTSGWSGPVSWVLPWAVLAVPAAGVLSRVVAVALRGAIAQPYVVAARARGSSPRAILLRDALPNAAGEVLSVAGTLAGGLLVGTLVVEVIFGWAGIGGYFVEAVGFRDIPAIQACVLLFAGGYVLVNRTVDLLHALVDPRARRTEAGGG